MISLFRVVVFGLIWIPGVYAHLDHAGRDAPDGEPSALHGFSVSLHPDAARRFAFPFPPDFDAVRATGATHVSLPVPLIQRDAECVAIRLGEVDHAMLSEVIVAATRAGLVVVVAPFITLTSGARGDWRGTLRPRDERAWWNGYRDALTELARVANAAGASYFVIGSELTSLSSKHAPWFGVANAVRRVFAGELIFVANHDALDLRAPFAAADIVGVSAYRDLDAPRDAMGRPTEAGLRDSFREFLLELQAVREEIAMPLMIFELGFRSVAGATRAPWDYTRGGPVDVIEQARAYSATLGVVADEGAFLRGVLLYTWLGPGGAHDRHYTPRGKPAEVIARRFFRSRRETRPGLR